MKWLSLYLGGQKWTVYLVPAKSKFLVDEDEPSSVQTGMCVYDDCKIYISKALDEEAREDTLLHELLHAILHVSGSTKVYDFDPEKDETLVTAMTPILHRLLKDLGFRFPRLAT